ncbi:MAG: PAS domain S-box protein [Candidatus Omnitrophica bacterium]|nr:PAS domain S-box protein [Candidatus Omnitrophota bacterium]
MKEKKKTKMKNREKVLQTSEAQLRTIIEKNPDGIIIVDKDGIVLFFNEVAMFLFNRRRKEFIGKPFAIPLVAGDLTEIDIVRTEKEFGASGVAQMRTAEINWEGKSAYLVSIRDITELKQAEKLKAELTERKKLDQLKDEFISTVSHELRTPLSITRAGVSLLLQEIPGKISEKQREILQDSIEGIDGLAGIINDLLDISKIEAGRVELRKKLIDISSLVKNVISFFRSQAGAKKISLKTSFRSTLPDIFVDTDKIIQVFNNLIGNAIKFTPEKGEITVEVSDGRKEVKVSVKDTGIGIAPENLGKVFDRFQQFGRVAGSGAKGTGLGLSISKGIIQMHKGNIWVESPPTGEAGPPAGEAGKFGKGSKFIFTLPKLSSEFIVKEYIDNGIKEAMNRGVKLSIIVISIGDFKKSLKKVGKEKMHKILTNLEEMARKTLRRATDIAVRHKTEVVVILPEAKKVDAFVVKDRLEEAIKEYMRDLMGKIQINLGTATFPDETGNTETEALINKTKTQLEAIYTGPERRRSKRRRVRVRIGVSIAGKDKEAELDYVTTRDLGEEGLGLYTKDKLKPGTKLFISIQDPSQNIPLETEGEVIWSKAFGKDKGFPYRTGIRLKKVGGVKSILELLKS